MSVMLATMREKSLAFGLDAKASRLERTYVTFEAE